MIEHIWMNCFTQLWRVMSRIWMNFVKYTNNSKSCQMSAYDLFYSWYLPGCAHTHTRSLAPFLSLSLFLSHTLPLSHTHTLTHVVFCSLCSWFSYAWCTSCLYLTRLTCKSDMTHSYVWRDLFVRVIWFVRVCEVTHIWVCAMTHSGHVCHDSFRCATWFMYLGDSMYPHVFNELFLCMMFLIRMCSRIHPCTRHDSFLHVTGFMHLDNGMYQHAFNDLFLCMMFLIRVGSRIHSYSRHDSFVCVTGFMYLGNRRCQHGWGTNVEWFIPVYDVTHP